jgi:hypothetical protein
LIAVGLAILAHLAFDLRQTMHKSSAVPSQATMAIGYGTLVLSVEANQGQIDPSVNYLTLGQGYKLFLTPNEAVLSCENDRVRRIDGSS